MFLLLVVKCRKSNGGRNNDYIRDNKTRQGAGINAFKAIQVSHGKTFTVEHSENRQWWKAHQEAEYKKGQEMKIGRTKLRLSSGKVVRFKNSAARNRFERVAMAIKHGFKLRKRK